MAERIYQSGVSDSDRAALDAARTTIRAALDATDPAAALAAHPDAIMEVLSAAGTLATLSERVQLEASDLDTLYTMTVEHAAFVEEELFRRNNEISSFLASMSHELRTPLTAIIGYSELLMEDLEERGLESPVADASTIVSSGRYLLALINDVLDVSKFDAGHMEMFWEQVDIREIMRDVETTAQPLARLNDNRFAVTLAPDVGEWVVDATRLRQCVLNLLSNAFKFTRAGEVHLRVAVDPDWLVLTVSDTGVGMSPEQMERVFDEYVQARASTFRDYGGTGLGLSLTHRLCRAMGGDVVARSTPERGSTFTIRLPAREPVG